MMNFTQRSRSVSPVRSLSIPPPRARRDRVPGASLLRRAELSLHVGSTSAKQEAPICFASQPALPEKDNVFLALSSSHLMVDLAQRNSVEAVESDAASTLGRLSPPPPILDYKNAMRRFHLSDTQICMSLLQWGKKQD